MRHPKRTIVRDIRTRRALHPGREADQLEAETWPESIRVADRMTRGVSVIDADALAIGAADMMHARKIRHLPVVDSEERLIGIVTDRDLRQVVFDPAMRERLGSAAATVGTLRVRDVMTWGVVTVRPETDIREAARLMHERKLGALPVVAPDGKVRGILTESDVLLAKPYRWLAYR